MLNRSYEVAYGVLARLSIRESDRSWAETQCPTRVKNYIPWVDVFEANTFDKSQVGPRRDQSPPELGVGLPIHPENSFAKQFAFGEIHDCEVATTNSWIVRDQGCLFTQNDRIDDLRERLARRFKIELSFCVCCEVCDDLFEFER
jgi:hypothetical protein